MPPTPGPSAQGGGEVKLSLLGLALLSLFFLCASAVAQPTFPTLSGRVVDEAGLLNAADEAALTQKLEALEQNTRAQLVVVTLKSLQGVEIEDYGYRLGRAWGLGEKDLDNGALRIVAPNERKVRIEVGYGLEGQLTDALSSVIIQSKILPKFREGDFPAGIKAGADDIAAIISDPSLGEVRRKEADQQRVSAGGEQGGELLVLAFVIFFFFVLPMLRAMAGGGRGRRLRGDSGLGALPAVLVWDWIDRNGRGGGGWGGGGGGGFGGGGGSFGGGGSSGSW